MTQKNTPLLFFSPFISSLQRVAWVRFLSRTNSNAREAHALQAKMIHFAQCSYSSDSSHPHELKDMSTTGRNATQQHRRFGMLLLVQAANDTSHYHRKQAKWINKRNQRTRSINCWLLPGVVRREQLSPRRKVETNLKLFLLISGNVCSNKD